VLFDGIVAGGRVMDDVGFRRAWAIDEKKKTLVHISTIAGEANYAFTNSG